MQVLVIYGDKCPDNVFSVTPEGDCPPWTLAPEWLVSKALAHDTRLAKPERLSFLLNLAPGPHSVWKAAAVEPEEWWGILSIATYTGTYSECSSVLLLPNAPATSTLSAISKKEVCIYATNIRGDFLSILIQALGSLGTEKLILLNPTDPRDWHTLRLHGILGYIYAKRLSLPKALQLRALAEGDIDVERAEAKTKGSMAPRAPRPGVPQDLLKNAFGEDSEVALSLLSEVENGGGVMSYRALLDITRELSVRGSDIARRLILFGYLHLRQAQVELTSKGLYTLLHAR
ncbi:hypothetical protein [Infirmifilum uzonense]|uniref:hypothetical protein n=1 Tax=Infirmifilum uzonense TaxID=1550241 RepID=UPI000B273CC8|nr:hypothetical protein [Infirmifilum uzonense]